MTKEAQNDRTATSKFNDMTTANSNDTVNATGKKKQKKRSSEEQDAADLRQPKDPDPEPEPVALVEAEVKAILGDVITLNYLRNLCNDAVDEIGQGNERFRSFQDRFAAKFTQPCLYFNDLFKTATDVISCEELMNDIFKMHDNDSRCVIQLLVGLIDPDEGEEIDDPYVWAIRELAMRVSQQDPTTFFCIKEARANPDSVAMRSFWDRSDGDEFRLRTDSCAVRFWIISSCLLGHPWRYFFHITSSDPNNPRELLEFPPDAIPVSETTKVVEMQQKQLTPLEKQALAFQKYFYQKKQNGQHQGEVHNNVGKILDFESAGTSPSSSTNTSKGLKGTQKNRGGGDDMTDKQSLKKAKQRAGRVQFKPVVSGDMKSATTSTSKNKRKEKENSLITSPNRIRQKSNDDNKASGNQVQTGDDNGDEVVVTKVVQHDVEEYSSEEEIIFTGWHQT